jgi:putative ABC transport system permease protein
MAFNPADTREFLRLAVEALSRYTLRTALSVLGVVFGVAAVIAMMSVSEGARREALAQMEALGLDNLVARSRQSSVFGGFAQGLSAADAERAAALVPLARVATPLIERTLPAAREGQTATARVLGVRPDYRQVLRLTVSRGRFLSAADEKIVAPVSVLGASLARQLFGFRDPLGERVRLGQSFFEVIGVLSEHGVDPRAAGALAWRDINQTAMVPLPVLSGRTIAVSPHQPADEIWLNVADGSRIDEVAPIFSNTLSRLHSGRASFDVVIPRELLAQRYRTQRTFGVVVGSIAVLALIVGGIGIMNVMLTSVVERTREIGVRRTVGARRSDVTMQFLVEALLMTASGGALGLALGVAVSWGITAYAGWDTHVSALAVLLGLTVSLLVGLVFGIYPAIQAARLEPVEALRHE